MTYSKKQRKVSVIMGIYNCASTLAEAIDSLLAQTYTDWELIMCDDGSIDETVAIAESYVERFDNILLIRNEYNMGLPATLNHCLEYAESEYIARMDGDDKSMPGRFQKEVDFLDLHPEYALVSCSMLCFDEKGVWGEQGHKAIPTKRDFAFESPFCHAPCVMRREALADVGNYTVRKDLRRGQDYYLWHKFYCKNYKGYNIQEPLYMMRDDQDAANRGRSLSRAFHSMRIKAEVMRNLKLPFWLYYRLFRNFFVALLPTSLYLKLHHAKVNRHALKLHKEFSIEQGKNN